MTTQPIAVNVRVDARSFIRKVRAIRIAVLLARFELWLLDLDWRRIDRAVMRVVSFGFIVALLYALHIAAALVIYLLFSPAGRELIGH